MYRLLLSRQVQSNYQLFNPRLLVRFMPRLLPARIVSSILLILPLLVGSLGTNSSVAAPHENAEVLSASIGFNGLYKVGKWTPIEIEFQSNAPGPLQLDVWTEDSDGAPTRFSKLIQATNSSAPRRAALTIKPGRVAGIVRVVLSGSGRQLAEQRFVRGEQGDLPSAVDRGEYIVVSIGACENLRRTLQEQPQLRALGVNLAEQTAASSLPTRWNGYDGVDFVVLLGSRAATQDLLVDHARMSALERWLKQGGQTIFSVGENLEDLLASQTSATQLISPGKLTGITELRESGSLETFAGVTEALLVRGARSRNRIRVPKLIDVRGTVIAAEGTSPAMVPLIVRQNISFGEFTFVAVDLNNSLLDIWSGTAPMISRLIFPDLQQAKSAELRSGRFSHLGFDDLSGQFRSALGQFADQGVRFLPFGLFAGLLVIYLLMIGPGDYFLLKRFFPRMEFTWITFGLVVAVTCLATVLLASWAKGNAWHRNKVDLVDVDVASGFARGQTWFTLFSPKSAEFDLQLEVSDDQHATLAWMGLPGPGLGGMESTAAPPLFAEGYRFAPDAPRLDGVPLQIWSTKNFTASWFPENNFGLQASLYRERLGLDDVVEGTIENDSQRDWNQAVLLFDRWVIPLGTIAAGERVTIDERTPAMVAAQHFTRRRRLGDSDVVIVYDKASLDLPRIMEMILFHQAAGGQEYTRLKHQHESRLDFSRLLSPERAMLLVQSDQPAVAIEQTNLELSAENERQWTFLRFVIPVEESGEAND